MTENEKLRALLAEARGSLARHQFNPESPACVLCGGESGIDVGRSCPYAFDYDLAKRIDAALAEPVVDPVQAWKDANGYNDLLAAYSSTITERDEARAEVERLQERLGDKAEVDSGRLSAAFTEGTLAAGDAMRSHSEMAYQRGAEAMREAAAEYVKNASHEDGLGMGSQRMESGIRALPLPEDKR